MRTSSRTACHAILVAAVLASVALLAPNEASADPYIGIGIGPTLSLDHWPHQVRVEQEIGYSFGGRSGFFLSFAPSQSWGNDFWLLTFPLGIGGLFDVVTNRNFVFQLGPMGTVGFALSNHFDDGRDLDPWFHFGFNFMLRFLVANNRLGIYVKPIGLEFGVGDSHRGHGSFDGRYYLAGGIHFYF